MSDQSQTPEITETMIRLLKEVKKHTFSPKETTFFSIEGVIGRYEDATSDLLRFFMSSDEQHDLARVFLRAFFVCLQEDCRELRFERVNAQTRVQTSDRKFIDLLVLGHDWVLVIENKIGAQLYNPLTSYEEHAKRCFPNRKAHLAILSPDGKMDPDLPQWKAVSYQEYCSALKCEFAKAVFDLPVSKWQVFAREFILHLENRLYNPAMTLTPEQQAFVETNLREIGELKKLSDAYTLDLKHELSERVQRSFPGIQVQFVDSYNGNFFVSQRANIGNLGLEFAFWTPSHEHGNPERKFVVAAWVKGLTEVQFEQATDLLMRNNTAQDEGGYWMGERSFDNRKDAVDELSVLAKELFDLWGSESPTIPSTGTAL